MNPGSAITSALIAMMNQYISSATADGKVTKDQAVNEFLIPTLANHLKKHKGKLLTNDDFTSIKEAINKTKVSKTVKKVLEDYNASIENIMKGEEDTDG